MVFCCSSAMVAVEIAAAGTSDADGGGHGGLWRRTSMRCALPSTASVSCVYTDSCKSRHGYRISSSLLLSSKNTVTPQHRIECAPSFLAISPLNRLLFFPDEGRRGFDRGMVNGVVDIRAMRHGKRVKKLGRSSQVRRALLRSLTTHLLRYGRIKTTLAKAKAMRKFVDKMITLAKKGGFEKRKQALGFIYDVGVIDAMFALAPDRYRDRNGGYTRVYKTMPRRGDNAPMAYIELV